MDPLNGNIKILDFGLSRIEDSARSIQTGYVATRYYRAPEVIMTWQHYKRPIDMWSFGCIVAELLKRGPPGSRTPLFRGDTPITQLVQIAQLLGCPDAEYLARIDGPAKDYIMNAPEFQVERRPFHLQPIFGADDQANPPDAEAMDLLEKLLVYDPEQRLTAEQAIAHPFFAQYRDEQDEPVLQMPFNDDFERLELDAGGWRAMILELLAGLEEKAPP